MAKRCHYSVVSFSSFAQLFGPFTENFLQSRSCADLQELEKSPEGYKNLLAALRPLSSSPLQCFSGRAAALGPDKAADWQNEAGERGQMATGIEWTVCVPMPPAPQLVFFFFFQFIFIAAAVTGETAAPHSRCLLIESLHFHLYAEWERVCSRLWADRGRSSTGRVCRLCCSFAKCDCGVQSNQQLVARWSSGHVFQPLLAPKFIFIPVWPEVVPAAVFLTLTSFFRRFLSL